MKAEVEGINMKAILNEEGKKVWGAIFPDGVPVLDIASRTAEIEELGKDIKVYMVAWDALTPVQRGQILNLLSEKFKCSVRIIENDILDKGLPLQAKYVSGVAIPTRMLI